MRRTVLIEGILLLMIGLVSMGEGLRLITQMDPQAVSDVLGPGWYVLFIGLTLIATAIVHFIAHYRETPSVKKVAVDRPMRMLMITMVVVMAVYTFLIEITGYLVATPLFFLAEFRVIGVKSWLTNILLTIAMTAVYYLVFVRYCDMVFPRGILF